MEGCRNILPLFKKNTTMSKRYFILITFMTMLVVAVLATRTKQHDVPVLLERNALLAADASWADTKNAIRLLEQKLTENQNDVKSRLLLVQAYIREGRITGNHVYYDGLAFSHVNKILKKDPQNFEALCSKATIQASEHQFSEALATANEGIQINPYNSYVCGVKCDAQVELGMYSEAIKTADKMSSLRPDIKSYTRISYLREIYGDYEGSKEAMEMALQSGAPGLEETEWVRVYLGHLYQLTGDDQKAAYYYRTSLVNRPGYPVALSALGELFMVNNELDSALKYYLRATETAPDYSYYMALGNIYKGKGLKEQSEKAYNSSMDILIKHKQATSEENGEGHFVDKELAQLNIAMGKYDEAYSNAMMEYNRRPLNIDINETLAWAALHAGRLKEAQEHITMALKTNSKNPKLHFKAAIIYQRANEIQKSKEYAGMARATNKNIDFYFKYSM